MRRIALGLALMAGPLWAGDFQTLDEAGVRAALEGRTLTYGSGAWQEFRASGKTLYNSGSPSWGNWRVQDGQYCSQWPPSDLWACYDMFSDGETVRFVGQAGDISDGRYSD